MNTVLVHVCRGAAKIGYKSIKIDQTLDQIRR